MDDFRSNFLKESAKNLEDFQKKLRKEFSEDFRREVFRIVHSIKGSAQTFGLSNTARLADELENLLSRREITENKNLQTSFFEGMELLIVFLKKKNKKNPVSFFEKLKKENLKSSSKSELLLTGLPFSVFRKLSENEKNAVISALGDKKRLFLVKADFEKINFAAEYQFIRKFLNQNGEIIAALPDNNFVSKNRTGFDILISTNREPQDLLSDTNFFSAEIISLNKVENPAKELSEMLRQIAGHAQETGKKIDFTILANVLTLSAPITKAVFDIILQLVRNAVAHAFENSGKIRILLFSEDKNIFLTVSDNGKGIDLEKVSRRAIEKNLILSDDTLNEQQTLELIFASELSTADQIGDISGRGIGLDIVKNLVEKLNGKISVKSRKDFGTKFEIILPLEEI